MLKISSITDAFGVATSVLVVAFCLFSLFCIGYVLYFRFKIRHGRMLALEEFNAVWLVRIMLIVSAILWALVELIQLPILMNHISLLGLSQQETICDVHTVLSFGLMEPCFFLTALFLVQGSVRDAPFTPLRKWNKKTISLTVLFCFPLVCLQLSLVIVTSKLASEDGKVFGMPSYLTRSHVRSSDKVICTFPLISTALLGLFSLVYNFCFLWWGYRMLALVINKRLQMRVRGLVLSLALLLPLQVLFQGLSVLSRPGIFLFELMSFLSFLTPLICMIIGEAMLVAQPITDALAVRWVFNSRVNQISFDPLSRPVFVLGNEEDISPCPLMKESLDSDPYEKPSSPREGSVSMVRI